MVIAPTSSWGLRLEQWPLYSESGLCLSGAEQPGGPGLVPPLGPVSGLQLCFKPTLQPKRRVWLAPLLAADRTACDIFLPLPRVESINQSINPALRIPQLLFFK